MKKYGIYHVRYNQIVKLDYGEAIFDTEKEAISYSRWFDNYYNTYTYVKEIEITEK